MPKSNIFQSADSVEQLLETIKAESPSLLKNGCVYFNDTYGKVTPVDLSSINYPVGINSGLFLNPSLLLSVKAQGKSKGTHSQGTVYDPITKEQYTVITHSIYTQRFALYKYYAETQTAIRLTPAEIRELNCDDKKANINKLMNEFSKLKSQTETPFVLKKKYMLPEGTVLVVNNNINNNNNNNHPAMVITKKTKPKLETEIIESSSMYQTKMIIHHGIYEYEKTVEEILADAVKKGEELPRVKFKGEENPLTVHNYPVFGTSGFPIKLFLVADLLVDENPYITVLYYQDEQGNRFELIPNDHYKKNKVLCFEPTETDTTVSMLTKNEILGLPIKDIGKDYLNLSYEGRRVFRRTQLVQLIRSNPKRYAKVLQANGNINFTKREDLINLFGEINSIALDSYIDSVIESVSDTVSNNNREELQQSSLSQSKTPNKANKSKRQTPNQRDVSILRMELKPNLYDYQNTTEEIIERQAPGHGLPFVSYKGKKHRVTPSNYPVFHGSGIPIQLVLIPFLEPAKTNETIKKSFNAVYYYTDPETNKKYKLISRGRYCADYRLCFEPSANDTAITMLSQADILKLPLQDDGHDNLKDCRLYEKRVYRRSELLYHIKKYPEKYPYLRNDRLSEIVYVSPSQETVIPEDVRIETQITEPTPCVVNDSFSIQSLCELSAHPITSNSPASTVPVLANAGEPHFTGNANNKSPVYILESPLMFGSEFEQWLLKNQFTSPVPMVNGMRESPNIEEFLNVSPIKDLSNPSPLLNRACPSPVKFIDYTTPRQGNTFNLFQPVAVRPEIIQPTAKRPLPPSSPDPKRPCTSFSPGNNN